MVRSWGRSAPVRPRAAAPLRRSRARWRCRRRPRRRNLWWRGQPWRGPHHRCSAARSTARASWTSRRPRHDGPVGGHARRLPLVVAAAPVRLRVAHRRASYRGGAGAGRRKAGRRGGRAAGCRRGRTEHPIAAEVAGEVVAAGEVGAAVAFGRAKNVSKKPGTASGGMRSSASRPIRRRRWTATARAGQTRRCAAAHAAGGQRVGDGGSEPQRVGHAEAGGRVHERCGGAEAEHAGRRVAGPVDGEPDPLDPGVRGAR